MRAGLQAYQTEGRPGARGCNARGRMRQRRAEQSKAVEYRWANAIVSSRRCRVRGKGQTGIEEQVDVNNRSCAACLTAAARSSLLGCVKRERRPGLDVDTAGGEDGALARVGLLIVHGLQPSGAVVRSLVRTGPDSWDCRFCHQRSCLLPSELLEMLVLYFYPI
jgi:hypothetical protein